MHPSTSNEETQAHLTQRRRRLAVLLLVTSLGPLYSDILIARVAGFAVTLPHILLVLTTIIIFLNTRRINWGVTVIVYAMVFLELAHALLFGFAGVADWMQSLAQFTLYATALVVLSGLRLTCDDLGAMAPMVHRIALLFGSLSIFQSGLLNLGYPALLPPSVRAGSYSPLDEMRTGAFTPAVGLAVEPSYYAIGLVTLLAYVFFLSNMEDSRERRVAWLPIIVLLAGIAATFSITGIASAGILVVVQLVTSRVLKTRYVFLVAILFIIAVMNGVAEPIQNRLGKIVRGTDNSALIRTVAPMRLLVAAPDDVELLLLGTGLGMEERNASQYYQIYQDVSLRDQDLVSINIHNILAASKYFTGWIGLILYLALLGRIIHVSGHHWRNYFVLLIYLIVFHFASGLYLYPSTWVMLALLNIFRYGQLSETPVRLRLRRRSYMYPGTNPKPELPESYASKRTHV